MTTNSAIFEDCKKLMEASTKLKTGCIVIAFSLPSEDGGAVGTGEIHHNMTDGIVAAALASILSTRLKSELDKIMQTEKEVVQ